MVHEPATIPIRPTPALAIVLAWLVVVVPASWGVYSTALNAKKLFAPVLPPARVMPAVNPLR